MRRRRRIPTDLASTPAFRRIALAAELFERERTGLLAIARSASVCLADAEDAVQRSFEIFIGKAPVEAADRPLPWLRVVVRNEAVAISKRRRRLLTGAGTSIRGDVGELETASDGPGPVERLIEGDRAEQAAARLARLKRDERRALGLQAAGCSYAEIAAICNWTPTKVNRCIAEGRASLAPLAVETS